MSNNKEYKVLTLRGLDDFDNKDIVRIMNDVATKQGLKTGQSIIEWIIRNYQHQRIEIERIKKLNDDKVSKLENEISKLQASSQLYKDFHDTFAQLLKIDSKIKPVEAPQR